MNRLIIWDSKQLIKYSWAICIESCQNSSYAVILRIYFNIEVRHWFLCYILKLKFDVLFIKSSYSGYCLFSAYTLFNVMYPLSTYIRKQLILLYLDSSFHYCITNADAILYWLLGMALDPAERRWALRTMLIYCNGRQSLYTWGSSSFIIDLQSERSVRDFFQQDGVLCFAYFNFIASSNLYITNSNVHCIFQFYLVYLL